MKLLVCAHPDDEALWWSPESFDRIVIVFSGHPDRPGLGPARLKAIEAHPLKDRIICLDVTESGIFHKADDVNAQWCHKNNANHVVRLLKAIKADEVTTHNAMGEYQHPDHILVHNACMEAFDCPVNGKDPKIFRAIKAAYEAAGCWTWY
jgi:LmbE family N-acetylglucosaminyl deacetylase